MSPRLQPQKLFVTFKESSGPEGPKYPRCYTLTHSDRTGDMFLTIGPEVDRAQISGLYTRLMRDEVVACWEMDEGIAVLRVQLHVSGGLILGTAAWRDSIFRHHLQQVLEAFRYGDRELYRSFPELESAPIEVYFNSSNSKYDRSEEWGSPRDYRIQEP